MHQVFRYEYEFLFSLIFTISIETVVLFYLIRFYFKMDKSQLSNPLLIFSGIICSMATLPYLWFIFPVFLKSRTMFMLIGEIYVALVEAVILSFLLRLEAKKALIASVACNVISFIFGLLFSKYIVHFLAGMILS